MYLIHSLQTNRICCSINSSNSSKHTNNIGYTINKTDQLLTTARPNQGDRPEQTSLQLQPAPDWLAGWSSGIECFWRLLAPAKQWVSSEQPTPTTDNTGQNARQISQTDSKGVTTSLFLLWTCSNHYGWNRVTTQTWKLLRTLFRDWIKEPQK